MRLTALLFLSLLGPVASASATTTLYGSADQALPFFGRLASARTAALGGAFHALAHGDDAIIGNPAGLVGVDTLGVGLHHESWLADINLETAYLVAPVTRSLVLGSYLHVVDYGTFDVRDDNGQRIGTMGARDYAVDLAGALKAGGGFSGGLALRGLRESQLGQDYLGMTLDTGVSWEGPGGWSGGLTAMNVGPAVAGAPQAESLRWALARKFSNARGWLWPALGFTWEPHGSQRMNLGCEAHLAGRFDLRVGYEKPFGPALLDGLQGLTLGLGFQVAGMDMDYAYLPWGDLGAGQRISLAWHSSPRQWSAARPVPASRPDVPAPPPPVPTAVAAVPLSGPPPTLVPAIAPRSPTPVGPDQGLLIRHDPLARARALESQGRLGEALAAYEAVSQRHPDQVGAWRGLADLSYRLGDQPKAVAAYERLLVLQPDPDLKAWLDKYRQEAVVSRP